MFRCMFKIRFRKLKRSILLLFFTLAFSVASLTIALLIVRSQVMQYADNILEEYGNYDIAFCDVAQETEQQILQDKRFSELGYVYDLGQVSLVKSGNVINIGALKDEDTERMFYFHPVAGRYPEKKGEICMDRITLKCSGYEEKIGQKILVSCTDENGKIIKKEFELVGIFYDTGCCRCFSWNI